MHRVKPEDNEREFNYNGKSMYYKMELNERRLVRLERRFTDENEGKDDVHINGMQINKIYLH
jgi:hypothetical protein